MQLLSFSFKCPGWELKEMSGLQTTNLLVGKNSSGKTRTLRALRNIVNYIQSRRGLFAENIFSTTLKFHDPEDIHFSLSYSFEVNTEKVIREELEINNVKILKRKGEVAEFYFEKVNPPENKLIVQIRRDRELYPEIEKLMTWADRVVPVSISNINPITSVMDKLTDIIHPYPFSELVKKLSDDQKKEVMKEALILGYDLTTIQTKQIDSDNVIVTVKERYSKSEIADFRLSSGFLRTLYLLCLLKLIGDKILPSLLLIDDMGEGLDYSRAVDLGRLVFEECEKKNVQLIATTNDEFLMDVTDLSKWQVLVRKNSKINVLNRLNAEKLFKDFSYTGLNNFDFFSTEMIERYLLDKDKEKKEKRAGDLS